MSVVFMPNNQKGKVPPNQATIQKVGQKSFVMDVTIGKSTNHDQTDPAIFFNILMT